MAVEIFYSALHWAKKAERFATSAANSSQIARTAAAQASQASGKIVQLGFDGAIEDGKLVFKHAPSGVEIPYDLLDDYEYEVDMLYNSTEELSSDLPMVIKNGPDTVTFVSALHRDSTSYVTVGDMKAVMRYNADTGYRWLFKAAFKIAPNGTKVFLLYPVVASEEAVNSKITNCITEIPQDIKLELNNGTLTLKAGSKVYVPNGKNADGSNRFDEAVIASDKTHGSWGTITVSNVYVGLATNGNLWVGENNAVAYNTTDNIILQAGINQSSFPIALVTFNNGVVTSIDQVFNGFGYIGSTVFALPGVKGLIPNGRNADGSLKNEEFVTSKVVTHTWGSETYGTFDLALKNDNTFVWYSNLLVKSDNYLYNGNTYLGADKVVIGKFNINSSSDNGKIAFLYTKQAFHAVDRNDSSWVAQQAMPSNKYIDLTLGADKSTYTAPANGYFIINYAPDVPGLKYFRMINTTKGYSVAMHSGSVTFRIDLVLPVLKGDIMQCDYNATGTIQCFRFYYAEGEN